MKNNFTENFQNIYIKLGVKFNFFKYKKFLIPLIFLILYILFYFLIDFSSQSLVAHDEGLYARRSRLVEESENWFASPFISPHHKTLGSYWLIALSLRIFGSSELSIRLPSILTSFICLIICYLISSIVANKESALISVFSLSSMPLWIQYSRYASPDIPFVLTILLIIFFFLKFLDTFSNKQKYIYIFLSGFFISTAFFVRSYMAIVPLVGLSPFLIFHLLRTRNIFKHVFVSGIIFGSIPLLCNLFFAYKAFGIKGITTLFDFAKSQAIGTFDFSNFILIPINYILLTFPIGLLLVLFFIFTKPNNNLKYPLLIYYYPFISLSILLLMSSSYPHYFLFLLPALAIIFSIYVQSYFFRFSISNLVIKYLLLLCLFLIATAIILLFLFYNELFVNFSSKQISLIYIVSILFILSYLKSIQYLFDNSNKFNINIIEFLYIILIPQYLSLSLLYNFGVLGSPNIKTKLFLNHSRISSIINSNTIYLYNVLSKQETLLSYYLPSSKLINSLDNVHQYDYFITTDSSLLNQNNSKIIFRSIYNLDDELLLIQVDK